MTVVVLFILAVVWAVYLLSWVRSRTSHRRANSISSFSTHLSTLKRAVPGGTPEARVAPGVAPLRGGAYFAPHRPRLSVEKQRRRNILFGLGGATIVTALGAMAMGGALTTLFVLCLLLTGSYVVLLANAQKRRLEQRQKVRTMPAGRHFATPSQAAPASDGDDAARFAVGG